MRTLMIASAVIALIAADEAGAQVTVHRGAGYPAPGARPMQHPQGHRMMPNRWGSKIGGRWWGGANAPGGWSAYRRPARGYALPHYWVAPRFYITDWAGYGLAAPQPGYNWVRYYDDAVMIDSRGSVYDSADGIDWDEYRDGSDAGLDYSHDVRQAPPLGRRDDGVGGAVIGGVAGGVAGNLIAGRGNRLGGTLIGAGVGAAAGYAIDRNEDRRGPPPPPRHRGPGPGYPPPGADYGPDYGDDYPPPPPPHHGPNGYHDRGGTWVSPDGMTTVTTTNGYVDGSRYYGGGYGGTTTVTVQTAPAVTTTTTEIYEDRVWSRPHKKVWRKKVWRPKTKVRCACGS